MPTGKLDKSALPRNKAGNLNLNWAVRQALDKLGVDAKQAQVRSFIEKEYLALGRKATQNAGSLSTATTQMRHKLREELSKVPSVKVVPEAAVKKDITADAIGHAPTILNGEVTGKFDRVLEFVTGTLAPAMKIVADAEKVAGDRAKLKAALAVVEEAESKMPAYRLVTLVGTFDANAR